MSLASALVGWTDAVKIQFSLVQDLKTAESRLQSLQDEKRYTRPYVSSISEVTGFEHQGSASAQPTSMCMWPPVQHDDSNVVFYDQDTKYCLERVLKRAEKHEVELKTASTRMTEMKIEFDEQLRKLGRARERR